jgi:hypothetical protein
MEITGGNKLIGAMKDVILKNGKKENQRTSDRYAGTYILKAASLLAALAIVPTIITIGRDITRPTRYQQNNNIR